MADQTIPHCPLCGQEVHHYEQPALHPRAVPRQYGECRNQTCAAFGITLTIENILALTPEKAAAYAAQKIALMQSGS